MESLSDTHYYIPSTKAQKIVTAFKGEVQQNGLIKLQHVFPLSPHSLAAMMAGRSEVSKPGPRACDLPKEAQVYCPRSYSLPTGFLEST